MIRLASISVLIAISLVGLLVYFWLQQHDSEPLSEKRDALVVDDRSRHGVADNNERSGDRSPERGAEGQLSSMVDTIDRESELAKYREKVHAMYPDLLKILQIDDLQSQQLVDLLAEQFKEAVENPPFVPEGELEWEEYDKPEWVRDMEARQRRHENEIFVLLGDTKFSVWKHYSQTAGARHLVRILEARLDGTPDALAVDQMAPLIDAIAERQQRFVADESASLNPPGLKGFANYLNRLREGAAPYLSPRQMAEFDEILDEQIGKGRTRHQ